jgi:hypothetical protein
VRSVKLCFALLLLVASSATALPQSAKIVKVLPHYLDQKGRHTISPSLYERDAYQALLRTKPDERSGLRFDVQWKASGLKEVKVRVELRGAAGKQPTKAVVESTETPRGGWSKWSGLAVTGDEYKKLGELVAWRVTLWDGDKLLAEQKSFLW